MKCNYCGAELVDGSTVCPSCGMETHTEAEELSAEAVEVAEASLTPESKEEIPTTEIQNGMKVTPGRIALAIAAGVLLLAALVALVLNSVNGDLLHKADPTDPVQVTDPTEDAREATIPADGNPDDVTCKGSYSVTDEEALAARNDVVATMGDAVLTNGQLQIFYWEEVFAFLQEYGTSYAAYFGLDYTQPLDTQLCQAGDGSMTWQQYFLRSALNNWSVYQALDLEGKANNLELDEDYLAEREGLADQLEEAALEDGYKNADEMVRESYGSGATLEDFLKFARVNNEGFLYFQHVYDSFQISDEDVDAYFTENEASYAENEITRDSGKYVDVRHVLLMPEDENVTTGEDGYPVYSEDAWEACRLAAENLYAQWQTGDLSEDSFAQLAREHSMDGSASQGGLYTDVYEGQMVEAFENWCFDSSRQVGDHGLIKTQYGYHIMFYVGSSDIWFEIAKEDMLAEKSSSIVPSAMEKHPATIHYGAIKLGVRDLT